MNTNISNDLMFSTIVQVIHNMSSGVKTFGPVFNATFLKAVLELQQSIKAIKTENNYTLADICFAPLSSEFLGKVTLEQCTVQSIWGYWKDNVDTFDETREDDDGYTENYLDHFIVCSQSVSLTVNEKLK